MGCCGQGRAAFRQIQDTSTADRRVPDRSVARVLLRYQAQAPIAVRGVHTGRMYSFDGEHAQQQVEHHDAVAMLKSRFFRRID